MVYLRLAAWAICAIAFGAMVGRWFRVCHNAARMVVMLCVALSLFCLFWFLALFWSILSEAGIPNFEIFSTVSVSILAIAAVFFLLKFPNGD